MATFLELERKKQTLVELTSSLPLFESRVQRTQQELASNQRTLAQARDVIPRIQRALAAAQASGDTARVQSIQADLATAESAVASLERDESRLQTQLAQQQETLRDVEQDIARLQAEINSTQPTTTTAPIAESPTGQGTAGTAEEPIPTRAPAPVRPNLDVVWDVDSGSFGIWNADTGTFTQTGFESEEAARTAIADQDPAVADFFEASRQQSAADFEASEQEAVKQATINQATLQSRYNQPGSTDWRVRLQLAPGSDYLYNATPPGILAPLAATNGVLFPYVPQIVTGYKSNYEQYQLIHSNFRGLYYKNSQVDDVQIRGVFTAQDTREAEYLLAVIHFFRSVTKMFYGQDAERGTPPPLVYLSGFGDYQFSKHPCVVAGFQYQLPDNVDYIRATNPNNYGENLLNRRTPVQASPGGVNFAGAVRLFNALIPKGAVPETPSPGNVPQSVNNTQKSTYVPTRMEIDITLIPLQSREQISKQFSLKSFANGDLIKGGYW